MWVTHYVIRNNQEYREATVSSWHDIHMRSIVLYPHLLDDNYDFHRAKGKPQSVYCPCYSTIPGRENPLRKVIVYSTLPHD